MPATAPNRFYSRATQMKALTRRMFQVGVYVLVQALILFATAGTLKWGAAWAYLLLYLAFITVIAFLLIPKGSGLIEERSRIRSDAKSWDVWLGALIMFLGLVILFVAALDQRIHWSDFIPLPIKTVAWLLMAFGDGVFAWSMNSNPFFSAAVRIQKDRGHHVIRAGPYQYVRHPGYAGQLLNALCIPLQLGSLVALIPAVLFAIALFARTSLEDRTLQAELDGYQAYTRDVPYRLIPGIW